MKYMKLSDLEPGDVIKFNADFIVGWDRTFQEQAKKYRAVVKSVFVYNNHEINQAYNVTIDFVDTCGKIIRNWHFDFYENNVPFDVVEIKDK